MIYKKFIFAENSNIMAQTKTKEKLSCTISKELFNEWKNCKRTGDATKIKEITGKSYPVVQRALKYGSVFDPGLIQAINKYFSDRKEQEQTAADNLK